MNTLSFAVGADLGFTSRVLVELSPARSRLARPDEREETWVGIDDAAIWGPALTAVAVVAAAVCRLKTASIQANRDTRIAAMALEDSKPGDRPDILDGLAKLRPFHPESPGPDPADGPPDGQELQKISRGRRR